MNTEKLTKTLLAACSRLLRPLIKVLLRYGVGFNAFSDMIKRLYIDVARSDFALPGKKQTASRISTMTGLSRKEVSRVSQLPDFEASLDCAHVNRAARVIGGWVKDKNFQDQHGEPLDLAFDDDGPSFGELVKQYSGDITARTIADELLRVGAILVTSSGKIRLAQKAYVPKDDQLQKLNILGTDVSDLIASIDHNLQSPESPYFQRKVCYQNIAESCLPDLREKLNIQAQKSLEQIQKSIESTAKPGKGKQARRLGVGIYYFEQDEDEG